MAVDLRDGRTIIVPLVWYPSLLNASPQQRSNWQISGGGYGIHWPDIDGDLSTEGILRGAPAASRPATARSKSFVIADLSPNSLNSLDVQIVISTLAAGDESAFCLTEHGVAKVGQALFVN